MASTLTLPQKREQRARFMRECSAERDPLDLSKSELNTAITAIDNRIASLLNDIETALPTLSSEQHLDLVKYNIMIRLEAL